MPLQIFEYNGSAIGGSSQLDHSASLLPLLCFAFLLAIATAARCRDAASPLRVPPERCRPPPPAPAAVAMAGKECVAIASDLRFGVQLATLATDYKKIYKIHDQLFIGLAGLGSDAETL